MYMTSSICRSADDLDLVCHSIVLLPANAAMPKQRRPGNLISVWDANEGLNFTRMLQGSLQGFLGVPISLRVCENLKDLPHPHVLPFLVKAFGSLF